MGESTKRTRGGRVHKDDQGWEKAQRGPGMGESTKRTRGGRVHKDDQGWEKAQREPGGVGGGGRCPKMHSGWQDISRETSFMGRYLDRTEEKKDPVEVKERRGRGGEPAGGYFEFSRRREDTHGGTGVGEVNGKVGRRTRMLEDTTRVAKIEVYI